MTVLPLGPGTDWRAAAACAGDLDTFFAASPDEAKKICQGCRVRPECLHDAVETDPRIGVWGGLTRKERRRLPALPAERTAAIAALRDLLADDDTSGAQPRPAKARPTVTKPKPAAATPAQMPTPPEPAATPEKSESAPKAKQTGRPNGGRFTPEQRAEYERRTIELLVAGASFSEIIREVGISAPTIVRIRRRAGLPRTERTGGHPPRPRAEVLSEYLEPYGDGHARWTGPMSGRLPQLYADGGRFNVRHVLFEQHHGRLPVGYARSNCGEQACVAGGHLTDDLLRKAQPPRAPKPADPSAERTSPPMTATSPATPPAAAAADSPPVDSLLEWADGHPDSEVRDQSARARVALTGLRQRHAADQELNAITSEAEQLEKRLAELRAREAELAPPKGRRQHSYKAATVRAWAKENGVDCPDTGRVPKRVVDAWRQATEQTEAGTP